MYTNDKDSVETVVSTYNNSIESEICFILIRDRVLSCVNNAFQLLLSA